MINDVSYIILSSIPMFVCAFWMIAFFGQYKKSHKSLKILFWFMLTATSLYFGHFVVFNHVDSLIPITDTIYSFATLSVYPIYYLYIEALTNKMRNWLYLILLPGLVVASIIGICYAVIPDSLMSDFIQFCLYEKGTLPDNGACRLSMAAHETMKYIILADVLLVLPFGLRRLSKFRKCVKENFSNTEHKDLKEVRYLVIAFVCTSFFSMIADVIGRAFFVDSTILVIIVLTPFAIMLYLLGYIGNMQKFTVDDLLKEIKTDTELPKVVEDTDDFKHQLKKQIDDLMIEEKMFLQPDLKLSDIATKLSTNRTYVYEALKVGEDTESLSFTDYVNKFRIRYASDLLEKMGEDVNVESVIYECGFTSRATFYRNFKKYMGKTPKEYIKQKGGE